MALQSAPKAGNLEKFYKWIHLPARYKETEALEKVDICLRTQSQGSDPDLWLQTLSASHHHGGFQYGVHRLQSPPEGSLQGFSDMLILLII